MEMSSHVPYLEEKEGVQETESISNDMIHCWLTESCIMLSGYYKNAHIQSYYTISRVALTN